MLDPFPDSYLTIDSLILLLALRNGRSIRDVFVSRSIWRHLNLKMM